MNKGDTGKAYVYLGCLSDIARQRNKCFAILFLDIVAAFASLMRKIIFDIDGGDEAWLFALHNAWFSSDEVKEIYDEVCISMSALFECNTVSVALASCMYQYTWASTEGLPQIMHTVSGVLQELL